MNALRGTIAGEPVNRSLSEYLRDALQILRQPDDDIDELDLAYIRDLLGKALAIQDTEISEQLARSLLKAREEEILSLQADLRAAMQRIDSLTKQIPQRASRAEA